MAEGWSNHGCEIFATETAKEESIPPTSPSALFNSGAIKTATLQWYKMKWHYTASANDLWGEEAQGFAEVVPNSPLADCPLFNSNSVTPVRMRYFNLLGGDDAANDFRCTFLKFDDSENPGPLDMAFSTGRVSCFNNMASLQQFLAAMDGDEDRVRDWALLTQENYFALVDGIRRYPKCWTELDYYDHATFSVKTEQGRQLIRFRLHGDNDEESRLTKAEQQEAWIMGRPDIELPEDTYLHQRIRNVASQQLRTTLQVQMRPAEPLDLTCLNPCQMWEEETHPWQDLAHIALTYCVPKHISERAKFNFTRTPEYIPLETTAGMDNYGGLINIQEKVLTSTTRKKRTEATPPHSKKTTTYLVHVETGNYMFSGTDAGVYIAIYGTKGRTKKVLLDKLFHNDFERGSKESYYITVPYIGDILFTKVFLIGGKYTIARTWFLSNIVMYDLSSKKLFEFPCYRWISDRIVLPIGTAKLAKHETTVDQRYNRRLNREERERLTPWSHVEGLPSRIGYSNYKELPYDLKNATERTLEKKVNLTDVLLKLKLHQYTTAFHSFDSFDDFKNMYGLIPLSETAKLLIEDDLWKTDEEYGREFLAGVNPIMICRLNEPLEKFPVSDDDVDGLLDRGMSLQEEIKAGHIYHIDYPHIQGVERAGGDNPRYVSNPIVMFYVRSSGQLVPIAIQLEQTPGPENPIWTPKDPDTAWLLAKMWVKAADAHYQTMYNHLTRGHLVFEALTLAVLRKCPSNHPVYKLLIPHTKYSIAVIEGGIDLLLQPETGAFTRLLAIPGNEITVMKRIFAQFEMSDMILPKDLAKRGVDDAEKLPNYFYRDDALLHWNLLAEFVNKIMSTFYKTDSDVANDLELQEFMKDIHDNALHGKGFPGCLKTTAELFEFLTMFIFHSSCYHSALNYGQLDYFGFGPNYPSSMRKPPPTRKDTVEMKDVIETLPDKSKQALALAVSSYLTEPISDELYLGDFPEGQFTEPHVREILEWFKDELEKISEKIHKRNTELKVPYVYLLPEKVTNSAGQ